MYRNEAAERLRTDYGHEDCDCNFIVDLHAALDWQRRNTVERIDQQAIVDAAFPTGGTEGPNAWTEGRIRVRTQFARQLERILDEVVS